MAWFWKKKEGEERPTKVQIAEGLWVKCDSCKEIVYRAEVDRAGRVIPLILLALLSVNAAPVGLCAAGEADIVRARWLMGTVLEVRFPARTGGADDLAEAAELDRAVVERDHPAQDLHERGLPRAAGSDERHEFTGGDSQRHPSERRRLAAR